MATHTEYVPRRSAEFVESSILEAVVPSDSTIDIEDEIDSWDGLHEEESSSILPSLTQRQVLLFGKCTPLVRHLQPLTHT
jgi:hypothetical protein